jgi:hypothetical protein
MKGISKFDYEMMEVKAIARFALIFFLCWFFLTDTKHVETQQVIENQKNSCFDEEGKEVEVIDWSDL